MENLDPQTAFAALAVGGAILFGAVKFLTGFSGDSKEASETPAKSKSVPKPSKKKTKKKTAEKPQQKAKVAEKKVTINPIKQELEKTPEIVPEVAAASKKKKKKKKKKVQPKTEDAASGTNVKSPNDNQTPRTASEFVSSESAVEDGWETVPVKSRKKASIPLNSQLTRETTADTQKDKKKIRETVSVGEYSSVIVGEGGGTIGNIESVSGAKVNLNRELKTCTITGDVESVAVAKQLVQSLVSNQSKHTMTVTSRLDKAILGKSDTIKTVRELSGAKLDISFGNKDEPMSVTIVGENEKVQHAKQLIEDYLEGKTPEGLDGIKRIQVNEFQGRILIGQKGAQITELQKSSGASINVEFVDDSKALVSVIGTQQQIESGLESIRMFLADHMFSTTLTLDSDARGVLMKLNDLRKAIPNLKVDVSSDRAEICLTGTEEGVTEGRSKISNWIKRELGPPEIKKGEILEEIDLGGAAGKVIGKNRSVLNQILSNSVGAKIELKQGSVCYVYGQPQGVKKAVSEIKEIIAKHDQVVAKSAEEQEELESANWVVLDGSERQSSNGIAPESDWGGFRLSQSQKW